MFWKKKSPEFGSEDVQALVNKALPAVQESVGEPVYMTIEDEPSLVTQSQVLREVEQLLSTATETLDTAQIASRLRLARPSIDAIVERAVDSSKSFFDGVHVLPSRRIDDIGNSVLSKQQVTQMSEICSSHRITVKAATYAVKRKAPELIVLQDFVVPAKVLDHHADSMKSQLDQAQQPIKFSTIEPDAVMLPLVKKRLGIPGHQQEFFPPQFLQAKLADAERLLKNTGYVASSVLSDVEDATKFAKRSNSIVLGSGAWVVSREFIADQRQQLVAELNDRLYFDLRDLPLGPHLAKYLVEEDNEKNLSKFRSQKYPKSYLVKSQLERDLLSKINTKLEGQAQERALAIDLSEVNGSSAVSDFAKKLELPTLMDVTTLIEETDKVPSELRIADNILPHVRQHYSAVGLKELKPRFEHKLEKLESKVRCYLNAILTIPDGADFKSIAWEEWQQYVSENQFSVPANPEVADRQFQVPLDVVRETTVELRERAIKRLAATKDSAKNYPLILHLTAMIYHSVHFCKEASPGMLKIRGKAVPNLIKQFDFPSIFVDMLRQIKSPPSELVVQVREAATGQ